MRTTQMRREFAEQAERAGLGRFVRMYRPGHDLAVPSLLFALAAIPVVLAVLFLAANPSIRRALVLLVVILAFVVLVWLVVAWAYWDPVNDPDRLWFAVLDGGLLVTAQAWTRPVVAAWHSLRVEPRVAEGTRRDCLVWQDSNDGSHRELDTTALCGRRGLIRAVSRGAPVSPSRGIHVARIVAVGSVTAIAVWLAGVPAAMDIVVGERPAHIADLSRICTGGAPFGRAAAYEGPGPHPVAVYDNDGGLPVYPARWDPGGTPKADAVQLVGCIRHVGRASNVPLKTCGPYSRSGLPGEQEYSYDVYQGRYRIDVYEARTGDHVTSVTVAGTSESTCSQSISASRSTPRQDSIETEPDAAGYAAHLSRLLNARTGD